MGTAKRPSKRRQNKTSPLIQRVNRRKISVKTPLVRRRLPLRQLIIVYGVLIVGSAVCAVMVAHSSTATKSQSLKDPFTPGQHTAVSFSLYYPASLPSGYYIDSASTTSVQASVVTMRITNGLGDSAPDGRAINISQQAVPANVSVQTFLDSLGAKTTVKTKHGRATIGTIDDGKTRIASLVTSDGTWILLNSRATVSLEDMSYVLSHLSN